MKIRMTALFVMIAGLGTSAQGESLLAVLETAGSASVHEFASALDTGGDINSDGFGDVVVGSRHDNTNGSNAGSSVVFSGADGSVLYSLAGSAAGELMGYGVAICGDVDQDGSDDFAVGAPGKGLGELVVYSGATGAIVYSFIGGSGSAPFLGTAADGNVDVNADGSLDIIVGATGSSGHVLVYSGADGSLLHHKTNFNSGGNVGYSVAGVGDVDGDGFDDFFAGGPGEGLNNQGRAYLFSGQSGSQLRVHVGNAGDSFGWSVTAAGDVDADGRPDYAVGAPQDSTAFPMQPGYVKIYSGMDGSELHGFNGAGPYHTFGRTISDGGDLDGDGFDDLLAGAKGESCAISLFGTVSALSGQDGSFLLKLCGSGTQTGFGMAVGGNFDANGDAVPDIASSGVGNALVYSGSGFGGQNSAESYGAACSGSGGYAPTLSLEGCVAPLSDVILSVGSGLGGATSLLFFGAFPVDLPLGAGCSLLVIPLPPVAVLPLSGSGPGAGSIDIPATVPASASSGKVWMQVFVVDPGATMGYTSTNGLEVVVQ